MKLKKYGKGGKYDMYQEGGGVKVTKKMVEKQFYDDLEESLNLTNSLAKQLATGIGADGMPLKKARLKQLKLEVEMRKARELKQKPNYRDVGTII